MLLIMMFIQLALGCFFALVGYSVAKGKGKEPGVWAVICFFLGLIGLLILLLSSDERVPRRRSYGHSSKRDDGRSYSKRSYSKKGGSRSTSRRSREKPTSDRAREIAERIRRHKNQE